MFRLSCFMLSLLSLFHSKAYISTHTYIHTKMGRWRGFKEPVNSYQATMSLGHIASIEQNNAANVRRKGRLRISGSSSFLSQGHISTAVQTNDCELGWLVEILPCHWLAMSLWVGYLCKREKICIRLLGRLNELGHVKLLDTGLAHDMMGKCLLL